MALAGRILVARRVRLHLAEVSGRGGQGHVQRRDAFLRLPTLATAPTEERLNMDSQQASPEFSDYVHAIARRKGLLFAIAIPIAVLAILLTVALPDIYTSSALVEIDDNSTGSQALAATQPGPAGDSYADQYVQNLKGIV